MMLARATALALVLSAASAAFEPKNAVLLNAVNSTKTAFQKTFGPVVVSEIRNKTVLVNEAKAALNSTKAAIQSAVAPVLVPKIGDKYNDIIAIRNASEALFQPLNQKALQARAAYVDLNKKAQVTPAAEIQAAAFQNRTADPKLLAAQTLNDVYTYRKTKAEAKLGPSAVCKAIDKCNDPLVQAVSVLSVKDHQLSSYLSIYNDNMANNALLTAVSSSLQVTPKPINLNNANNIAVGCTQGPITDYYSGQGYDPIDFTSKYTQWISVGMTDENTDACQQSEDVGPSCATVCSRRMMTCNPCAMKAATTSFAALMWALTQAGNSVTASACASDYATKAGFPLTDDPKDQVLAFLNSPAASAPFVPSNSYAGWNGELCGTLPEDNFRLYFCNPPNYNLVAQIYGYTDPCQVPSWTRDYTTFKTDSFPGATSGALCFCERTLPGI